MESQRKYIPKDVREVTQSVHEWGYKSIACLLGRKVVGSRLRDENGGLIEEYGLRDNEKCGYERHWSNDGVLLYRRYFVDGKQHGIARQWNSKGTLLIVYRMRRGTGIDIWCNEDGELQEEHPVRDGMRHGPERWWNENQRTIYIERYWYEGDLHGIEREWAETGRLRRGFPKYFIRNRQVNKQTYMREARKNQTLSPFRSKDNAPQRVLPREYLRAREAAKNETEKWENRDSHLL